MKVIKIIMPILVIILLCGCSKSTKENAITWETYVNLDTCVEYFASDDSHNSGNVTFKYDTNEHLKINEDCLKWKNKIRKEN